MIAAQGSAPTITGFGGYYTLTNSGTIANTGGGPAIAGAAIRLNNGMAGTITGAIRLSDALVLDNKGVIDGDVRIDTPAAVYMPNSSMDSTEGIINGNLTFGASHDQIHAIIKDDQLFTGVTGTVDGGAGNDGIILHVGQDSRIAASIILPGFDYLNIMTATGATATLADGFASNGPLSFSGSGAVINQTNLVADGYLGIQIGDNYGYNATFSNRGTITGNSLNNNGDVDGPGAAISLYGAAFDNSGTIDIVGNAIGAGGFFRFSNSGTITATNTAVRVDFGSFANSGAIRSTGGTALYIDSFDNVIRVNSGTIDGAVAGVAQVGGVLRNTGLISSSGTAVAPMGGMVYNDVDGTIRGGAMAIGPRTGGAGVYTSTIVNAGRIDGNVDLSGGSSQATFVALRGGILNGSLTLGASNLFVTDLSTGFAGVNGMIAANGAKLRYFISSDATATSGAVGGFSTVSYEVGAGSTLTLGASSPMTDSLTLAGRGKVVLNGDIQVTDVPAVAVAAPVQLLDTQNVGSNLLIVNNATLSGTQSVWPSYPRAPLIDLGSSSFTNKGTIIYRAITSGPNLLTAIGGAVHGGGTVINEGSITLETAAAIGGVASIINSGTIIGDMSSQGVAAPDITNSGTIRVGREAVMGSYWSAKLRNSGTITGTVNLADSPYSGSTYGSSYVAQGGVVQGDLLFGRGNDLFLLKSGATMGVSGIIDGGEGANTFGQEYAGTATVMVDAPITGMRNFQQRLTVATGAQANVTLVAGAQMTGPVFVDGDGSIVNRVSTTGTIAIYSPNAGAGSSTSAKVLQSFTNEANVGDMQINAHSFSNSADIGVDRDPRLSANALFVSANDRLSFVNSGRIVGNSPYYAAASLQASDLTSLSAGNSGAVDGGMTIGFRYLEGTWTSTVAVRNSGTINAGSTSVALGIAAARNGGKGIVAVENSGTIDGVGTGLAIQDAGPLTGDQSGMAADTITAISVTNSGAIRTSGNGVRTSSYDGTESYVRPAASILSSTGERLTLVNMAGGSIAANGADSVAIAANALSLTNDGVIRGGTGAEATYARYAGAVQTYAADDMVRNNGAIIGSIDLGDGSDIFENYGTVKGNVSLGGGNDIFIQSLLAVIDGTVDGGDGTDTIIFDITGTTVSIDDALRSKFVNFEVEANCQKDRRVIEALGSVLQGSDRPLLITSGTGIGDPGDGTPAVEDVMNLDHPNPRIASELAGQRLLEKGVNVSVTRLPQVHDTVKQGLITPYIDIARQKGSVAYVGKGDNCWPAAHVLDVARLYALAIEHGEAGACYHAVAEEGISSRAIAEVVGAGLGLPVVSVTPEEAQEQLGWLSMFAGLDMPASSRKTRERLGWKATGPDMLTDLKAMDYAATLV